MLNSVAVLSDVHGVLPALDAVLAEPDVRAADLVVLTGDHAAGPQPLQVLDRMLGLGERAVMVRGNADRELAALARGADLDLDDPVSTWAASQLGPRHVELLEGLPHPVTLPVRGFGRVLFCHGSPRDDEEVLLVDTRIGRWQEAFAGVREDVRTVVCGHTHMPFLRLVDRRLVVNPGSVGMPYGGAGAHWALLRDGAVTLRHAAFDVEAAAHVVVRGVCRVGRLLPALAGLGRGGAGGLRPPGRSRRRLSPHRAAEAAPGG
jgi:predicted phosphodiesterase